MWTVYRLDGGRMIIVGTPEEYRFLAGKCDGRCAVGEWCIFADGDNADLCPVDGEKNFIIAVKNKYDGLEVEE